MRAAGIVIIVSWVVFTLVTFYPLRLPLEIAKDPFGGAGKAFGYVGLLVLGIWLYTRGKKRH